MVNFIKYFIIPSNLIFILLFAGLISILYRRIRRYSIFLFGAGTIIFIVFANGPVSYWLIGNLESRYPAMISFEGIQKYDKIVILPGYSTSDSYFPLSSKVNSSTAFRLVEALRIWRSFPDAKILISGSKAEPDIIKKLLSALGLPEDRVIIEAESESTYENAVVLKEKLGDKPFILITSAGHMPRAVGVFKKLGMNPIPAPTDYMAGNNPLAANFLPTPSHLMYSDLAIHEYLGILFYKLTGRL
jgi:uncharacterized SAM-binding protein YcdF (DUF218 family)